MYIRYEHNGLPFQFNNLDALHSEDAEEKQDAKIQEKFKRKMSSSAYFILEPPISRLKRREISHHLRLLHPQMCRVPWEDKTVQYTMSSPKQFLKQVTVYRRPTRSLKEIQTQYNIIDKIGHVTNRKMCFSPT